MFDSTDKGLDEIRAELLQADEKTLKDVEFYIKLARLKSLWNSALISFVLDALIVIGELAKPFRWKR